MILKDAYVLTLNPLNEFGKYTIFINDGVIKEIIPADNTEKIQKLEEKYGNQDVYDCSDRIIMPAFTNSCLKSEGSLIKYLLKHRHYELEKEDLCTDFILNYIYQELPSSEVISDLCNIYNYSLTRELKSGNLFVNAITPRKDTNHFEPISQTVSLTKQNLRSVYRINQDIINLSKYKKLNFSNYLADENQLTIYDLSVLNDLKNNGITKLFLEVAVNKEVCDSFRKLYNKPVIVLLDEYGLIDNETSLINPIYLTYDEIKILKERDANIIICPRDLMHFTNKYFPLDEFLNNGLKFSIATGWLGESLFQEVRLLRNKYRELNLSSKTLLESITKVPHSLYFKNENSQYYIDTGKNADLVFISTNDLRFQFYPENNTYERLCDFLIDNLNVYIISDVLSKGEFIVKDHKLTDIDEAIVIKAAEETRDRLYSVGKYSDLQERNKQKKYIEELDLRSRNQDEVFQFSEAGVTAVKASIDEKEDFRIKGKLQVFKQKVSPFQRSLFDEEKTQLIQQLPENDSPTINLLHSDITDELKNEEEIKHLRKAEEKIFVEDIQDKKPAKKMSNEESKVELPKNVKLKFGDD